MSSRYFNPAKLLEYKVIEETRMIGEYFMSSRKFNQAELLELLSN